MNLNRHRPRAMTLFELVLVLFILSTMVAIVTPSLARFFGGRTLKEESRRFLGLTRYARSQAIACSTPMELWIDPDRGDYGLSPALGYPREDHRPVTYRLSAGLSFEIPKTNLGREGRSQATFLPDGRIDGGGLEWVILRNERDETIEIHREARGLRYSIQELDELAQRGGRQGGRR